MNVKFTHESGTPSFRVPAYFAADGNAAETSAQAGTKWRAHLSPDKTGKWNYEISFHKGQAIVETDNPKAEAVTPFHRKKGQFTIAASDKSSPDFCARGRLQHVGEPYLKFAGSGDYFFKVGADVPETLLGYADFDGTFALKAKVPLKSYAPHLRDFRGGDPTWQNGKGKGLIARFGHNLALNWNLGEENTQTTKQVRDMVDFIAKLDPYGHNIVIHTFPDQQDKVYGPLLGDKSKLTGVSLQNGNIHDTHWQTVKWVRESQAAGKPWVVAFDESGTAAHGQCPDLGYEGYDGRDNTGKMTYTEHEVRSQTLWGMLMGGGAGVEYYFGYQYAQNDLVCEDWRSRDRSWDYCRIAKDFFHDNEIPFVQMQPATELVSNDLKSNDRYCFAKPNEVYLVYIAKGDSTSLDLTDASGQFTLQWFNPRSGGSLKTGDVKSLTGGATVNLGLAPSEEKKDWLAVIRKSK
jgi:hypothetical protein